MAVIGSILQEEKMNDLLKKVPGFVGQVLVFFAVFMLLGMFVFHTYESWVGELLTAFFAVIFIRLFEHLANRRKARRNKS
jgi:Flp pilus assembly protein TadB